MRTRARNFIYRFIVLLVMTVLFAIAASDNARRVLHSLRTYISLVREIPEIRAELTQLRSAILSKPTPVSDKGTLYYAQGGVVVDSVAYFTANHEENRNPDFPFVVSFQTTPPFKKIRTFQFTDTYDSSPLCLTTKKGKSLIIAHEYLQERTRAINTKTGNTEWMSDAKHPGYYFFGYSYYTRYDSSKVILGAFHNGLHAFDLDSGKERWWLEKSSIGGITPCVDQKNHFVYYQYDGGLAKIDARSGQVIKQVVVAPPNITVSWNTVLIDDANGYYIATYWYGKPVRDSAIRVYNIDLELQWEQKSLTAGKKATLSYAQGKLITGTGNWWTEEYFGDDWKRLTAWSIKDGAIAWECKLDEYGFCAIYNVPYFNGYFYAETQDPPGFSSRLFRIDARDGTIESILEYGRPIFACATPVIAHGMMFSGDLVSRDGIVVTRLALGSKADWKGPFSDPQTNQNAVSDEKGVTNVAMEEILQSLP